MTTIFAWVLAAALAVPAGGAFQGAGRETQPTPQGGGRVSKPEPAPPKPRAPRRTPPPRPLPAPAASVNLPSATSEITVRSTPAACDVSIDGAAIGATDSKGILTVSKLSAGKHVVTVRKSRYREEHREVTLVAGVPRSLEVALAPVSGRLTVNANVYGAEIRVGDTVHAGRVDDLELGPGRYDVVVSKLGFSTYRGTADIQPGRAVRIDAAIESLTPKQMVAMAEDEFVSEHYDRVVALCEMVLADKPNRPRANLLLGASYFRLGRAGESAVPLLRALEGGERIAAPVLQRRASIGHDEIPGFLVIGRDVLAFRAPGDPGLDFAVQLQDVLDVDLGRGANAPLRLTADISDDARLPNEGLCLVPCGSGIRELPGRKGRGKKDRGETRVSRPRSVSRAERGDERDEREWMREEIEYRADGSSDSLIDIVARLVTELRH